MKKILLLLTLMMSVASFSLVCAGNSDDEHVSDESSEKEFKDDREDTLLFDKIFLNHFETQDSRVLFLAGFFSSAERMITDFKGKKGYSPYGPFGNKLLIETLCEPARSKEDLIRIINQVLGDHICSKNIQETITARLTHLRDEITNKNEVNDAPELFYQQAVHKILLLHPEGRDTQARRLLGLSNVFRVCYAAFNDINTKDLMVSDEAFACGLDIYDLETLTQKIKNSLGSIVDAEDTNLLIKKLTKLRASVFKNFEGRDIKSLSPIEMKPFAAPLAQFYDQATLSVLDIFVGSGCVKHFKPVGDLLATLSR